MCYLPSLSTWYFWINIHITLTSFMLRLHLAPEIVFCVCPIRSRHIWRRQCLFPSSTFTMTSPFMRMCASTRMSFATWSRSITSHLHTAQKTSWMLSQSTGASREFRSSVCLHSFSILVKESSGFKFIHSFNFLMCGLDIYCFYSTTKKLKKCFFCLPQWL